MWNRNFHRLTWEMLATHCALNFPLRQKTQWCHFSRAWLELKTVDSAEKTDQLSMIKQATLMKSFAMHFLIFSIFWRKHMIIGEID